MERSRKYRNSLNIKIESDIIVQADEFNYLGALSEKVDKYS